MPGPPDELVRSLVDGPSMLSGLEYHEEVASTNALAIEAARRGVDEVYTIVADSQTAGRGRLGRRWEAPPGGSLLVSFVLRPRLDPSVIPLVPLLAGVALAEVADGYCPGHDVALKWPNDLLVDERKTAGILLERAVDGPASAERAVVVGVGVNVDWRGVDHPTLEGATSLAEVVGARVDRWRVLAGLVGVLSRRYTDWQADPTAFLGAYRQRCATLGQRVRVEGPSGRVITGQATEVADDGRLVVLTDAGEAEHLTAGDVTHVRGA